MNPWGYGLRELRRRRRRTASVEGVTRVGVVRHRRCRKVVGITIPRVRPSGITRGYAWCVPAGDSGCRLGGFFFLSLSTSPSPLLHFSKGSPFGHHPRLRMVCPLRGQWVQAGRFLFSLPLHFFTSPRVRLLGITRGYAWCVPAGDSECSSHHKKSV